MPDNSHALIPPSGLGRTANCPGEANLRLRLPEWDEDSEGAEFGTRGHEISAKKLTNFNLTRDFKAFSCDDVKEHRLRFLVDRCLWWLRDVEPKYMLLTWDLHVEERLELLDSAGYYLTHGTADLVMVPRDKDTLTVIDWKYHHALLDEDSARLQILAYLVGAMQRFGKSRGIGFLYLPVLDSQYRIEADLNPALKEIESVVRTAQRPDAPRNPGSWCRYCPGRGICPDLAAKAEELAVLLDAPRDGALPKTKLKERYDGHLTAMAERGDFESISRIAELTDIVQPAYDAARSMIRELILAGRDDDFSGWEIKRKTYRKVRNLIDLYRSLSPVLSDDEFADSITASWGKLEQHYMKHIQEEASKRGQKIPKTEAKELLESLLGPELVDHGWRIELRKKKG